MLSSGPWEGCTEWAVLEWGLENERPVHLRPLRTLGAGRQALSVKAGDTGRSVTVLSFLCCRF